ncbi:zinc finger CCHC domain-containing protein 8 [Synchiropus splendidus]|uniref:zinc finger CCHC domain-containing protein 8 n=1 Tax=Synchiropus splendidus TaxID=270530 RepID=UPI00237DBC18|nr:zinc finger CCHC domain-containing protein 8 [Synchiropus splendidus]
MSEVDFGDLELFQQLEDSAPTVPKHTRFPDDEDDQGETSRIREELEVSDERIVRLNEEIEALRRKVNILTRPSGITIEDVNSDGPVLQILYSNNFISKTCRQEIEDSVCGIILKHQNPASQGKDSYHLKPQKSAFALDEDAHKSCAKTIKTTTEAFKVVGSVLYFTSFTVDKLGQPLLNDNPQLTEGWEVPTYQQVFKQVIGTDGQEIEMKDKRPKSMCFNCGAGNHQMKDCPKPKDMAAINERRKEFNQNNQGMQNNQRYHADEVEERFSKYKPGVMSKELLAALGVEANTLPPLIYRMRLLGYPPGWLKEAEMENSGLTMYDGDDANHNNESNNASTQDISYDVSKLVDFPGFNVPAPHKIRDEFQMYNSVPMQSNHVKHNYAAYLSSNFATSNSHGSKRRHESDSSSHSRKRSRGSPDANSSRSSDMDIESDPGTSYHRGQGEFKFQPPLPPGSPCFSSPPPLPHGTPPATPTPPPLPKGTPPPTPTNGSPALRGQNFVVLDEAGDGNEDELSLEELVEQQRLIWAALENADTATSSDCDTPAIGTSISTSTGASTPAHADTEMEEGEEPMDTRPNALSPNSENPSEVETQEDVQSPGQVQSQEVQSSPQSPEPTNDSGTSITNISANKPADKVPASISAADNSAQSPGPVTSQNDSPQSPDPECSAEEDVVALSQSAVPHRSKFAAGIVPFEDTPEFTEVAEATGTYLRIRDLLKGSPRNLAKKK